MYGYNYDYYDYYAASRPEAAFVFGTLIIFLLIYLVAFAILIASYVMQSYSMYTIAKRRQLSRPWLAWIPCVNVWTLGAIADDFDRFKGNIPRNWRKLLLALSIISTCGVVCMYTVLMVFMVVAAFSGGGEIMSPAMIGIFIVAYVILFAAVMLSTALSFLGVICLFKLFESTVPEKAVKYTVISLIVPLGCPILLMKCRNKGYEVAPMQGYYPPQPYGANTYAPENTANGEWQNTVDNPTRFAHENDSDDNDNKA